MKKVKFLRILQCALTVAVLWQTHAFAQCGAGSGQCADWTDGCGNGFCLAGGSDGDQYVCCTPQSGQCCNFHDTYKVCAQLEFQCDDLVYHHRTGGPTSANCVGNPDGSGSCF